MAKLKNIFIACGVVLVACLLAFGGWQLFGPATSPSEVKVASNTPKQIQLTAVGDSLTYGVGDATNNGGYVGLTKSDLEATGQYQVTTKNYGVSGDTSTQILNRINKQAKIRTDLKRANIITVTAGGNDLMHVLQKHFLTLSEKQITAGSTAFQKRLTTLLTTIRKENPSAPIYVFGIYNPFYVYFPKMTAMTNSVTAWNQATQKHYNSLNTFTTLILTAFCRAGTQQQTRLRLKKRSKKQLPAKVIRLFSLRIIFIPIMLVMRR